MLPNVTLLAHNCQGLYDSLRSPRLQFRELLTTWGPHSGPLRHDLPRDAGPGLCLPHPAIGCPGRWLDLS